MPGRSWFRDGLRYLAAFALVGGAFGLRIALDPIFGPTRYVFSTFYLAVVLAAYFAGTGAAVAAATGSALLAYWAFVAPAFSWKFHLDALTSLGFFALTSAVDIYFITGMKRALENYRREHQRAEALANGNARLFKEFSQRTTHHLQLVAALLQSRADDGVDALYRSALTEASLRTMEISRAHRAMVEDAAAPVDFAAFARQLVRADLNAAALPQAEVEISGDSLTLPPEQATSAAVILLEWVEAMLRHPQYDRGTPIRLRIDSDPIGYRLRLAAPLPESARPTAPFMTDISRQIVDAAVEQLQGRFTWYRDAMNAVFDLAAPFERVPSAVSAPDQIDPPSNLLH